MSIRIGIDASSVKRLETIAKENVRFRELVTQPSDKTSLEPKSYSNFSIIEALFKALNCPTLFPLGEIRIAREGNSPPTISLVGDLGECWKNYQFAVSVTHHEDLIIAVVVCFNLCIPSLE